MRSLRRLLGDEQGATLAVTAVIIAGVLSMLALSIDLGMLRTAKADAQHAADAAALAGAQEFLRIAPATAAVGPARDSAMAFARRNNIRAVVIDSSEVTIQVLPNEQKVWVRIERQGIGLWFASLLGRTQSSVAAAAAAAARPANGATCVAPWAVPDAWADTGDDTNGNREWDVGEDWEFGDDPGDYYERFNNNPLAVPAETGYGSDYRNGNGSGVTNDFGRQITLKVDNPQSTLAAGFFNPIRIGTNSGAADYRRAIYECSNQVVTLGTPVRVESGRMVGPTEQGVDSLVALDPAAYWDPSTNTVINSSWGAGWLSSPRVKVLPLYDPNQIAAIKGGADIVFNNFALVFVEGHQQIGRNDTVVRGRLLYYARGLNAGGGSVFGSLIRVLQLVE